MKFGVKKLKILEILRGNDQVFYLDEFAETEDAGDGQIGALVSLPRRKTLETGRSTGDIRKC
jgi:hypothetical protein